MEQIHDRVAGLDMHRDQVTVCVRTSGPRGGVRTEKARFDTTTGGLAALAERLAGREVTLAAMEATGVYWKPVYYALEGRFLVWLRNAHHVKNVPGRKVIIAETGADMSCFPSPARLASWAGLCPGNHESAGKRRKVATTPGNPRLRRTLSSRPGLRHEPGTATSAPSTGR